jgi:hypothetical protein
MWSSLMGKPKAKVERKQRRRAPSRVEEEFGPPISPEEQRANLTELEQKLNREMKCQAGRNQVFLRSLLTGTGTTQPRITMKCYLRKDIGLKPEVFYEHIRDICCRDPEECEAYRQFRERFVET